jgi:RepB DNA-primase from phage plasmid
VRGIHTPHGDTHHYNRKDLTSAVNFVALVSEPHEHEGLTTFQTFDDGPNKRKDLARILHGSLEQHLKTLQALNDNGAGIYVMVNAGDGKGRTRANVIRVRAVFADFDGVALPDTWMLAPHIIVESSPGKFHVYWLVCGVSLEDFPIFQKALAKHFGSDTAVSDVCRVMRLPGFYHRKGEAVMVRLLEHKTHPRYSLAELLEAMPFLDTPQDKPKPTNERKANPHQAKTSDKPLDNYTYKALENECNTLAVMSPNSGRNVQLNKSAFALGQLVGASLLERSTVEDALLSAANDCGLISDDGESSVRATLKNGLEAGMKEPRDTSHLMNKWAFNEQWCSLNKSQALYDKKAFDEHSSNLYREWAKPSPWGR